MSFDESDNIQLVERAVAGDPEAFGMLFEAHYSMIYGFAYRMCFTREDAEDVAQETFIKAARSLNGCKQHTTFKQWLYRIALNTCHDRNRSRARGERTMAAYAEHDHQEHVADYSPVHEALEGLEESLRQAVTLVYMEGMSHADAAAVLDCAEATVSWRIFVAKRKLKRLMGGGR